MSKLITMVTIVLVFLSLIAAQCSGLATAPPAESQSKTGAEAAVAPGGPVIKVMEPRARASMPNGAVYMQLMNEGDADDRLIKAESVVAEAVELHESKMDENEVMRMSPVEMIAVPAGGSAILEPGGKHIMLLGLTEELATGDSFEVTLNFEQAEPQTIEVVVTEGMAMGHDHEDKDDADGE